jgi:hypothetical protein
MKPEFSKEPINLRMVYGLRDYNKRLPAEKGFAG